LQIGLASAAKAPDFFLNPKTGKNRGKENAGEGSAQAAGIPFGLQIADFDGIGSGQGITSTRL
jgi:hypothetical protein